LKLIIGIDDTDNTESRGTGHLTRQLSFNLMDLGFGKTKYIIRHQLLVDPRIPYTSHNSSASILFDHYGNDTTGLTAICREYLICSSAPGSDAGLCIACYDDVSEKICLWGDSAKKTVLNQDDAYQLAEEEGIFLEGLTGEKTGVIGSMAAVGLCKAGNDGRILWLEGLRELEPGIYTAGGLKKKISIDRIMNRKGKSILSTQEIILGEWNRPVMINNKITLIVEEEKNYGTGQWKVVSKEYIKSISE
jgi:hypothetical protein